MLEASKSGMNELGRHILWAKKFGPERRIGPVPRMLITWLHHEQRFTPCFAVPFSSARDMKLHARLCRSARLATRRLATLVLTLSHVLASSSEPESAGLALWLRADDVDACSASGGEAVLSWPDRSGNGYTATNSVNAIWYPT